MTKIIQHPVYIFVICFIVMPLNGAIIERGQYLLAAVLILLQIPWFMINVIKRLK